MKLGALKAAIRQAKNVGVYVEVGGVAKLLLLAQKGSMLEQLDEAFPGGKAQETGLYLREDGFLMKEPQP